MTLPDKIPGVALDVNFICHRFCESDVFWAFFNHDLNVCAVCANATVRGMGDNLSLYPAFVQKQQFVSHGDFPVDLSPRSGGGPLIAGRGSCGSDAD
jgi:hypothetical protein